MIIRNSQLAAHYTHAVTVRFTLRSSLHSGPELVVKWIQDAALSDSNLPWSQFFKTLEKATE